MPYMSHSKITNRDLKKILGDENSRRFKDQS
jgi:hypothetical protein